MKKTIMLSAVALILGVQMTNAMTVKADDISADQVTEQKDTTAVAAEESNEVVDEQPTAEEKVVTPSENIDDEKINDVTNSSSDEDITKDYPVDDMGRKLDPKTGRIIDPEGKKDSGWTNRDMLDADSVVRSGKLTDMVYSMWGNVAGLPQTPRTEKMIAKIKDAAEFLKPDDGLHYSSRDELEAYFANFDKDMATLETYGDDGNPIQHHSNNSVTESKSVNDYQAMIKVLSDRDADLYQADGNKVVNSTLAKNTVRSVDQLMSLNGNKYVYSPVDAWIKLDDVLTFEKVKMSVTTNKQATLFNDTGKTVGHRALSSNTTWNVDMTATINGQKMYHVGLNEWVSANDIQA